MATAEKPTRAQREKVRKRTFRRKETADNAEIGKPRLTLAQQAEGERLRKLCENNLEAFNVEVFPNSTGLKPFGAVQQDSIAHDQSIIDGGGKICKAEPRAFGKTSRTCNAALWAVLYGKRKMVPVFSANMEKSKNQIMARWKTELAKNERLFWMFPELLWPLRALENKPQRCASQTRLGQLTATQWTADRIVFPYSPGSPGSGAILIALPLKSARGATHTMPDGTVLRPDLVIFDDVQKDEDADNPNTINKREEDIDHVAMMLGGHSKSMSAIMNCTVRKPDDLSERYLKKPSWRRVRYKLLKRPATNEKELWLGRYAEIRQNYNPEDPADQKRAQRESLAFYIENRAAMDAGAEVTWEWCYHWDDEDSTEISAIQHAYNILIDLGEGVFAAECQNEPARDTGGLTILTPEQMRKKQSGYERNVVPKECVKLTSFVDIHDNIHYWHVWAWENNFTGYLIDYGTFPNQQRRQFSHSMLAIPLNMLFPGLDNPARITAGLDAVLHGYSSEGHPDQSVAGLMHREWIKTDGVPIKIAMCGVDANGEESDVIKKFIRNSDFQSTLYPSFGRYIGATTPPMSAWNRAKKSGDGPEWVSTKPSPGDPSGLSFDTNFWKTQFHRALALANGSRGATYVYKTDSPDHHRRLSDHWYVERPKEVSCGSRVVYEFPQKFKGDNHDFDCAVGARVAASRAGIKSVKGPPREQAVSFRQMQQQKRGRR